VSAAPRFSHGDHAKTLSSNGGETIYTSRGAEGRNYEGERRRRRRGANKRERARGVCAQAAGRTPARHNLSGGELRGFSWDRADREGPRGDTFPGRVKTEWGRSRRWGRAFYFGFSAAKKRSIVENKHRVMNA
jgi:hypothetical protein